MKLRRSERLAAGLAWGSDGRVPLLVSGAVVAVLATALLAFGRRLDAASEATVS